MGMMLSEPTLLKSLAPSNSFRAGQVIAADNRGSIFVISLETADNDGEITALPPAEWKIRTVATLHGSLSAANSSADSYALPYGLCAAFEGNRVWLGGGTSNAMIKKTEDVPEGELKNKSQMIFGFKVPDAVDKTYARGDFKELDDTAATVLAAGDPQPGWYFGLRPESGTHDEGEEYVSAKPVLLGDTMYIATFREKNRLDVKNANPCGVMRAVSGEARLYALDIKTGGAARWLDKDGKETTYITFEDTKVVDMGTRDGENATYVELITDDLGASDMSTVLSGQEGGGGGGFLHFWPGSGELPSRATMMYYWLKR
jgi:hypothetical protein